METEKFRAKADLFNRCVAKCLDLLIVATIYQVPLPVSFWLGLACLLLADGASSGKGVGKQLIGLRVIPFKNETAGEMGNVARASFRESVLRNLPWAAAYLCFQIPYVGGLLALLIASVELLLIVGSASGLRMGDAFAKTQVVNDIQTPS